MNAEAVTQLRDAGHSWRAIARQVGVSVRTLRRACQGCGKSVAKPIPGPSAFNPDQEALDGQLVQHLDESIPTREKVKLPVLGFARTAKRWRCRHRLWLPATT
jgi:hypothetical protein